MPEVTVNIYSRSYRLAVSTGEEALIQRCADIVDKQMKAIREGGKVINQDQIAVLAALEVAYEANKNVQKNSTDAQRSAAEKDAEIARLKDQLKQIQETTRWNGQRCDEEATAAGEAQRRAETAEAEVIQLKAKLYDLLVAGK